MSQDLRMTMSTIQDPEDEAIAQPGEDEHIPRRETGLRILLTILFVIIGSAIETLLAVIVIFELIVALGTRRPPSTRVRDAFTVLKVLIFSSLFLTIFLLPRITINPNLNFNNQTHHLQSLNDPRNYS